MLGELALLDDFAAFQIHQHRASVVERVIGDRAVFSGIWRAEPLIATIDAMLEEKRKLADDVITSGGAEAALTTMSNKELLQMFRLTL